MKAIIVALASFIALLHATPKQRDPRTVRIKSSVSATYHSNPPKVASRARSPSDISDNWDCKSKTRKQLASRSSYAFTTSPGPQVRSSSTAKFSANSLPRSAFKKAPVPTAGHIWTRIFVAEQLRENAFSLVPVLDSFMEYELVGAKREMSFTFNRKIMESLREALQNRRQPFDQSVMRKLRIQAHAKKTPRPLDEFERRQFIYYVSQMQKTRNWKCLGWIALCIVGIGIAALSFFRQFPRTL